MDRFLFDEVMEHTTDEAAACSSNPALQRIHRRVQKIKANEEIGVKYMQAWEKRYYELEEAKNEGRNEGRIEGMEKSMEKSRFAILQRAKGIGLSTEQLAEILKILGASPEDLNKLQ